MGLGSVNICSGGRVLLILEVGAEVDVLALLLLLCMVGWMQGKGSDMVKNIV